MITNAQSGTSITEVADGIYRISTPIPPSQMPGGFSFNQYLVVDDEPLLFHTGLRALFPLVREAIDAVIPSQTLRWLSFSHFESDECGALNSFLAVAPDAQPLCSRVAAMVSVGDYADRAPRALADGERISIGRHELEWLDAAHIPHGWETGFLFDHTTKTFLCGDLFTQGGTAETALTNGDLVEPAEAARAAFGPASGFPDMFANVTDAPARFERFANLGATTLAVMHGSAWSGTAEASAAMLRELGRRV